VEDYYENGQLKAKGNYKNGKLHGLWEAYRDDGSRISVECYHNNDKVDLSLCSGK